MEDRERSRENVYYWCKLVVRFYQGDIEQTLTKTCHVTKIL